MVPGFFQFQLGPRTILNEEELEENEYHLVCKKSVQFMSRFKFVKLHKHNPLVKEN